MLKFSNYISENSLYTDNKEKDSLLQNEEKVLDSLVINFLEFLSLFSLRNTGAFKKYDSTEGKLQVNSIDDKNYNVSLSIKLAYELDLINIDVVNRMTRLLALIKQKKLHQVKN